MKRGVLFLVIALALCPSAFAPVNPGAVIGSVTDSVTGEPIVGATITLTPGSINVTSSSHGAYVFPDVFPGTYTIQVSASGYQSNTRTTFVRSGSVAAVDFQLIPGEMSSLWGELSGEGNTGAYDASLILQWVIGLIDRFPIDESIMSPEFPQAADVSGNGTLSSYDASIILQKKVRLLDCFPADLNCDDYGPDSGAKPRSKLQRPSTQQTSVMQVPATTTGSPGAEIDVPIMLEDASNVFSYFFDLGFDGSILECLGVSNGTLTSGWTVPTVNVGEDRVLAASSGASALAGSGSLAVLHFRISSSATAGQSSPLHLESAELNDLIIETADGEVVVGIETDTDGDGMPDGWEIANGLDPLEDNADMDPDGDGLTNAQEYTNGTNPQESDKPPPPVVDVTPDSTGDSPKTTDDIMCRVTSESDVGEGRTAQYEYIWSNGAETIAHGPKQNLTDRLDGSLTRKHETWTCTVRCWNGILYSSAASDWTAIVNSTPEAPALSFPEQPGAGANLVCQVTTRSPDADGDPVSYTFQWWVKYEGVNDFNEFGSAFHKELASLVESSSTSVGDVWFCTVTPHDGEGDGTPAVSNECLVGSSGSQASSISLTVTPETVTLGRPVTLTGVIEPAPVAGGRAAFTCTLPSGQVLLNFPEGAQVTYLDNSYERKFYPAEASEGRDPWEVIASWGGDETYAEATSEPVAFTVAKATPTLTLELSASSVPAGLGGIDELTATATLMAPIPSELRHLLEGRTIELYWRDPDGHTATPSEALQATTAVETMPTGAEVGVATFDILNSGMDFSNAGTWKFQANFDEDDDFERATSPAYEDDDAVRLIVRDGAGYAIIVLGRYDYDAEGHPEHAKTADYVYSILRDRGFAHEDIYYIRDVLPGEEVGAGIEIDRAATQDNVQYAIEEWALARMSEIPAPLYVVFLDHGSEEVFHIYSTQDKDRYITPDDVAGYFAALRTGLHQTNPEAAEEEMVFIYGACHAGTFIPSLSDQERMVVTSCGPEEVSHRGVVDPDDDIRDGEVFITELFRNASRGRTLKRSFELAAEKVGEYTAERSNIGESDRLQHPLLDDPGERAEQLVLGFGSNAGRSVGWLYATPTVIGPDEIIDVLEARADRDHLAGDYVAWVEVKTPSYLGSTVVDPSNPDSQEVVEMPRISYNAAISDLDTGTFGWTVFDLSQEVDFGVPGTYKVFYYITDPHTGETSSYLLTTIYQAQEGNQAPLPVTLVYPDNDALMGSMPVFAWEETSDPEGNMFTYRLEVSEDSEFPEEGTIVKGGLLETVAVTTVADGIEDLQTYYWRVIPVDQFGATPANNAVRMFTTDFLNGDAQGSIVGRVSDSFSGTVIVGATITATPGPGIGRSDSQGKYVVSNLAKGTHVVEASAQGYHSRTGEAEVPAGKVAEADFRLERVKQPPVCQPINPVEFDEDGRDTSIDLDDYVSDADNPDAELSWTHSGAIEVAVQIHPSTHAVTLSPASNWHGGETIAFTCTDPGGLWDSTELELTVESVNDEPWINPPIPDPLSVETSVARIYDLSEYEHDVEDADTDLVWSVSAFDTSLFDAAIDQATDELTITPVDDIEGSHSIDLVLHDSEGGTASKSIEVMVSADMDEDGMLDAWEKEHGLDDASEDADADGLTNLEEYDLHTDPGDRDTDDDLLDDGDEVNTHGTDPRDSDSDDDGLEDGDEVNRGTDPIDIDSDNDGLEDGHEVNFYGTEPDNTDSDDDGMPDGWEGWYDCAPTINDASADIDSDSLTNIEEYELGTLPNNNDTDHDALRDGNEINDYGTNPLNADTDGDALRDGNEVNDYGTNPTLRDTDGDEFWDNVEIDTGTNPLIPNDHPEHSGVPRDVNCDGTVNALDVQLVINSALRIDIPYPASFSDLNVDTLCNAVDVQLVINAALGVDISEQV